MVSNCSSKAGYRSDVEHLAVPTQLALNLLDGLGMVFSDFNFINLIRMTLVILLMSFGLFIRVCRRVKHFAT